jgi:hypothetical protein
MSLLKAQVSCLKSKTPLLTCTAIVKRSIKDFDIRVDSLQSVLPKVLKKRGLHMQAESSRIVMLAQQWLEKALPSWSENVKVEKLSHATLCIACTHSIAAQECRQVSAMLLDFLHREANPRFVSDIRLLRDR